jgi:hypothetical protein
MIEELIRKMLDAGLLSEISIDDIRQIQTGMEVITVDERSGMEAFDTVFIFDVLTLDFETRQRILSYHESGNPPAVRFFRMP